MVIYGPCQTHQLKALCAERPEVSSEWCRGRRTGRASFLTGSVTELWDVVSSEAEDRLMWRPHPRAEEL